MSPALAQELGLTLHPLRTETTGGPGGRRELVLTDAIFGTSLGHVAVVKDVSISVELADGSWHDFLLPVVMVAQRAGNHRKILLGQPWMKRCGFDDGYSMGGEILTITPRGNPSSGETESTPIEIKFANDPDPDLPPGTFFAGALLRWPAECTLHECRKCGVQLPGLKSCKKCRPQSGQGRDYIGPRYCCKPCQVADWKRHKRECPMGGPPRRAREDPRREEGWSMSKVLAITMLVASLALVVQMFVVSGMPWGGAD